MSRSSKKGAAPAPERCVLLWNPRRDPPPALPLHPDEAVTPVRTERTTGIEQLLSPPGSAVLLLAAWNSSTAKLTAKLRGKKKWRDQPIFLLPTPAGRKAEKKAAPKRSSAKAGKTKAEKVPPATEQGVRTLPRSAAAFWETVHRAGGEWKSSAQGAWRDRRRHPRCPFRVTAYCSVETRTTDLSEGGVCFITDYPYQPGDKGSLDIRPLSRELGGACAFVVVAVETLRGKRRRNRRVHARFVNLDSAARKILGEYLSFLG